MGVAEHGAHLAGGEVENGAAIRVINETSFGAFDDDILESRSVAGQVLVGIGPESRIIVQRRDCLCSVFHIVFPLVVILQTR
ncbi:hypothetical protein D3C87_1986990 [compost metagenome]